MIPDLGPQGWAVVTLVIAALVAYQRRLGWRRYRSLHQLKRRVLPLVDRLTPYFVVSRKGGRDDAEFVGTAKGAPPKAVFQTLVGDYGFSPHVVNSIKRRPSPADGTPQYSIAHLVYFHDDEPDLEKQTEVYLFPASRGTDVYAHHETSVEAGKDHLTDTEQVDGDPEGVLPPWVSA